MMELLSPAGGLDSLIAAVQTGADAVYMGFGAFNARRSAKNFTDEEFASAVAYCHLRGVRVFLTLNTLLTDRELEQAAESLRKASDMGVDAILVQDWGLLTLAREIVPDVPLHASTQMSLFTLGGANEAAALGLERVVLARELACDEIREICAGCPAQIEVFAHGALCMCYSGQCEMSAVVGERSGNRGACAQPCRLPYGVNGPCRGGHPLSLKDANLSAYLAEMEAMGVACLKLEGRMKRPEYVAVVTGIYRRLLDEKRQPTAEESRRLEQAFSRSGFTDGYWLGKKGPQMFGTRPENAPEPKELFAKAREMYENGRENRKIPVSLAIRVQAGKPVSLAVACQSNNGLMNVWAQGPVPETARSRALTAEELRERLNKTGGTVFTVEQFRAELDDGLMLPASVINGLRRDALEGLKQRLEQDWFLRRMSPWQKEELRQGRDPHVRRVLEAAALPEAPEPPAAMRFTCSVQKAEQVTAALLAEKPAAVYVPVEELERLDPELDWGETELCAVLPRIFRTADETPLRQLLEQHPEASAVAIGNLGHLTIARGLNRTLRGDFGLNIFNSRALLFWQRQELASATVSFELRWQQVRDLRKYLPCEAIIYGRLPLMVTENCVTRCSVGCTHGAGSVLTDRTGARFPVLCGYGCRCEIQNSKTLFLADKPEMRRCGLTYGRLRFTTETPEQCVQVLQRYQNGGNWAPEDLTRGLFYRGVE